MSSEVAESPSKAEARAAAKQVAKEELKAKLKALQAARETREHDKQCSAFDGALWVPVIERRFAALTPGYRYFSDPVYESAFCEKDAARAAAKEKAKQAAKMRSRKAQAEDDGYVEETSISEDLAGLMCGRGRVSRLKRQWLYVLCDEGSGRKLRYEVYAHQPGQWFMKEDPPLAAAPDKRVAGWRELGPGSGERPDDSVPIDPGPECGRFKWHFFLSACQLDKASLQELLTSAADDLFVTQTFEDTTDHVEVPDPYHWTEDIHRLMYQPALDRWIGYSAVCEGRPADEQKRARIRISKLFIAETLIQMMGDVPGFKPQAPTHFRRCGKPDLVPDGSQSPKDPLGIQNDLSDWLSPYRFVANYRLQEYELRLKAERPLLNLMDWVYGSAHRIVDQAAVNLPRTHLQKFNVAHNVERGKQHWGRILTRMTDTEPGRLLLETVFCSKRGSRRWFPNELVRDRIPEYRKVLDERQKLAPKPEADGWALQVLVPAFIEILTFDGVDSAVEVAGQFLKIHDIYEGDPSKKKLYSKLGLSDQAKGLIANWRKNKNCPEALVWELREDKLKRVAVAFIVHDGEDIPNFKLVDSAVKAIQVFNFAFAAYEILKKAAPDEQGFDKFAKAVNLASSGLDMADLLLADALRQVGQQALKTGVASLGLISGIVTTVTCVKDAHGAATANDYSQAIGHGIGVAGGMLVTFGFAIQLAGALKAAAVGTIWASFAADAAGALPVGLLLVAIGGVLGIAGTLIACLSEDSIYEQFAAHCLFGDDYGDGDAAPAWAGGPFRSWKNDADEEAGIRLQEAALVRLLCQFTVRSDGFTGARVNVGWYRSTTQFKVRYEEYVAYGPQRIVNCTVSAATGKCTVDRAVAIHPGNSAQPRREEDISSSYAPAFTAKRDGDGRLREFAFAYGMSAPATLSPGRGDKRTLTEYTVQLDVFGDGSAMLPVQPLKHLVYDEKAGRINSETSRSAG